MLRLRRVVEPADAGQIAPGEPGPCGEGTTRGRVDDHREDDDPEGPASARGPDEVAQGTDGDGGAGLRGGAPRWCGTARMGLVPRPGGENALGSGGLRAEICRPLDH